MPRNKNKFISLKMETDFLSPETLDHISVCICTYKRPELLADLLNELQNQVSRELFDFSIVVVDNDSQRSAESVVSSISNTSNINIGYYVEPIQNISLARNKAIQNARGNFIAFIDDDEIPEKNWLFSLYQALRRFQVDGVLGPVFPYYKIMPPKWVIRGKFHERPTYHTGYVIDWRKGRTGNILFRKEMVEATGELFDPKFGSGAEDQDFVRIMIDKGYIFIWCKEACTYEHVPPLRWKRTFMIKKALLRGKTVLAKEKSNLLMIFISFIAIPIYTLSLPLLFVLGHHWFMQYLIKDFDHIGRILALVKLDAVKQIYVTE